MTVFADTFALIAWLNPRDDAHAQVTAYLDGFTGRLVLEDYLAQQTEAEWQREADEARHVARHDAVSAEPNGVEVGIFHNKPELDRPAGESLKVPVPPHHRALDPVTHNNLRLLQCETWNRLTLFILQFNRNAPRCGRGEVQN